MIGSEKRAPEIGSAPGSLVREETDMARIKVLDPTSRRMDDNANPGPDAGVLAGKRIGFRVDQIWRCWDWISENWAEKFRQAGAEVSYWRSTNRSGEEGEEQ